MSKAKKRSGSADYAGFLWRNVSDLHPTLNSMSVICRIENICGEYKELREAISKAEVSEFSLSILNYYVVAMIACLEWHAKARLADFLSYSPESLSPEDFATLKLDDALPLARSFTTIATLIGQMKSINSYSSYVDVFSRIFEKFESRTSAQKVIDAVAFEGGDGINVVDELFKNRHLLVHEISIMQVGPYTFRDTFIFDDADRTIDMIMRLVNSIEVHITEITPDDFPNKIVEKTRLSLLEDGISSASEELLENLAFCGGYAAEWREIKEFISKSYEEEKELIRKFTALRPVRHVDYRYILIEKLAQFRFDFIKYVDSVVEKA